MKKSSIETLLQKNPDAKEIFDENARKLEGCQPIIPQKRGYGLALPYGGKRLTVDNQTEINLPDAATYQRY